MNNNNSWEKNRKIKTIEIEKTSSWLLLDKMKLFRNYNLKKMVYRTNLKKCNTFTTVLSNPARLGQK